MDGDGCQNHKKRHQRETDQTEYKAGAIRIRFHFTDRRGDHAGKGNGQYHSLEPQYRPHHSSGECRPACVIFFKHKYTNWYKETGKENEYEGSERIGAFAGNHQRKPAHAVHGRDHTHEAATGEKRVCKVSG